MSIWFRSHKKKPAINGETPGKRGMITVALKNERKFYNANSFSKYSNYQVLTPDYAHKIKTRPVPAIQAGLAGWMFKCCALPGQRPQLGELLSRSIARTRNEIRPAAASRLPTQIKLRHSLERAADSLNQTSLRRTFTLE
jgi:hypothetical protein